MKFLFDFLIVEPLGSILLVFCLLFYAIFAGIAMVMLGLGFSLALCLCVVLCAFYYPTYFTCKCLPKKTIKGSVVEVLDDDDDGYVEVIAQLEGNYGKKSFSGFFRLEPDAEVIFSKQGFLWSFQAIDTEGRKISRKEISISPA